MTMSRYVCLPIALALAGPAIATQDGSETAMNRTPDSAQRFLASERPTRIAIVKKGQEEIHGEILAANALDACRTRYQSRTTRLIFISKITGKEITDRSSGELQTGQYTAERGVDPAGTEFETIIDWSKVRSVVNHERTEHTLPSVQVIEPNVPESYVVFMYSVNEQRDRVSAAMKFLQSACDAAAGTGF